MADLLPVRTALLDVTERLVADHPSTPAGSVIRCFARCVASVRRFGTPPGRLVAEAETLARDALARRAVPGQRVALDAQFSSLR